MPHTLLTAFRRIWPKISRTKYTRALEAEVARQGAEINRQREEICRLQAENRALLNSILGIAGLPPIPVTAADPTSTIQTGANPDVGVRSAGFQPANLREARKRQNRRQDAGATKGAQFPTPLRRRSWQQISRMLELESARKAATSGEV
jgi:hypothetical protein